MVGPVLGVDEVARVAAPLALRVLEEGALEVEVGTVGGDFLEVRQEVGGDERPGRLEAAVEVDGAEDRLEGVPEDRGARASAGEVFLAAEVEEVADADGAAFFGEDGLADEEGLDLGEVALTLVAVAFEEVLGDDEVEDGVAEEFEALVGGDALLLVRVDVRSVPESAVEEAGVVEPVMQAFLQRDQPAVAVVPAREPTRDSAQDPDGSLLSRPCIS